MAWATLTCLSLAGALVGADASAKGWDKMNDPENFIKFSENKTKVYNYKLSELPTSGMLSGDVNPWTDTYWPNKEGGIANRWSSPTERKKDLRTHRLYRLEELKNMSSLEIARLSPAEKYDIFMSRYDYPTVESEKMRIGDPKKWPSWTGMCHGWTPASLHHNEPQRVVVTNKDGISIEFYTSDITALMTYYYAFPAWKGAPQVGWNCGRREGDYTEDRDDRIRTCQDVNAGAFHVIMTNQLGKLNEGFAMDVERWKQIWNQPVVGFKTQILRDRRALAATDRRAKREVRVKTTLYYTKETGPHAGPTGSAGRTGVDYDYWVELDGEGKIVGGHWVSVERPDWLWLRGAEDFNGPSKEQIESESFLSSYEPGYFKGLQQIYRPVR